MAFYRYGKQPKREDARTLAFAKYLTPAAPPPPPSVDYGSAVADWGMLGNDTAGDCAWAGQAHADMLWVANSEHKQLALPTADVLAAYSAVTGYDPKQTQPDGENPTDGGTNLLDALKYWRSPGIDGHTITAFVEVDPKNEEHVKSAIALFGCLYIGVELPRAVEPTSAAVPEWTVTPNGSPENEPDPKAGHCVIYDAYDADGPNVVTWGQRLKASWGFHGAYCDEAYAMLSPDWFAGGTDPQGIDMQTLTHDLQLVTG
jgi:hypothetical protein